MTLDELIVAASTRPLNASIVQQACDEQQQLALELFDAFARRVANGYLQGRLSWSDCDAAMNHLFSYAYTFSDIGLSQYALKVFAAFDEAEYVHPEDPVDFNHEWRTRSMLAAIDELEFRT